MSKPLYHGSDTIVEKPKFGVGREDNDYGSGFYTSEDIDKAREWALTNGTDKAICNKYELDRTGLTVLCLNDCGTLAWIAEVLGHRGAKTNITNEIGNRLVEKYKIDTSSADVIIGYRADDSYIDVVEAFLNNELSIDEVEKLFHKGNLGQQVFIKSQKAFDRLVFAGYEEVKPLHEIGYVNEDAQARREVNNYLNNRRIAIQMNGFTPTGITARKAINNDFEYNKEYHYYSLAVKDEMPLNEVHSVEKIETNSRKGKKYELEL